jgi:hypothetical protein
MATLYGTNSSDWADALDIGSAFNFDFTTIS